MQTFLPFTDFEDSIQSLDASRLGKQRAETRQILDSLLGYTPSDRYPAFHPATKMWKGYEEALAAYGIKVCEEWRSRGYRDSTLEYFVKEYEKLVQSRGGFPGVIAKPPWVGNDAFHICHQSNLIRKKPEWYAEQFFCQNPDLPYLWPLQAEDGTWSLYLSNASYQRGEYRQLLPEWEFNPINRMVIVNGKETFT